MNKRKILSLAMALSIVAIMAVGATLAYFTDTDEATNTFTVGDVNVTLLESTLHRENDDASDEEIEEDADKYDEYLAAQGQNMVPGRQVKKAPYVRNDGDNAAYVRVIMTQSDVLWQTTAIMEYTTAQNENEIVASKPVQLENGDWQIVYTYVNALQPGQMTYRAPFWQIKIKDGLDNDDVANWAEPETITVKVEAIQAEGFADYQAAFAAFDAQKK